MTIETAPVIIAGGGPVGMTLALDLARRNVASIIAEASGDGANATVRCNHVSARSMEAFRRLGLADAIRQAGLPDDYPHDVVFRAGGNGPAFARIRIPGRAERPGFTAGPDANWATPEPPHRVNQLYIEPILRDAVLANPLITLIQGLEVTGYALEGEGVRVAARRTSDGVAQTLTGRFLAGCDGARSTVRRAMGSKLEGDAVIQRVQSTWFRAPALLDHLQPEIGWMTYLYQPDRSGTLLAIDGRESWLLHNYLRPEDADFDSVDRDRWLRHLLGVDGDFTYEVLRCEDWIGRRLVADRFQNGPVFICGDAAHLWVPYAGYGMNAGLADALDLSWQLAAVVQGWGGPGMIAAYAAERAPITDQVSRFAMNIAHKAISEREAVPPGLGDDTPEGAAVRAKLGEEAHRLHVQQFACAGLNFGYFYPDSPIIAYDGEDAPPYTMADYTPSTVPGCRLPHFWLRDGRSLYDALGLGYTLLEVGGVPGAALLQQAASRGIPLALLDLTGEAVPAEYGQALILVRPDGHVAWRGDALPADPGALLDRISGAMAHRATIAA